MPTTMADVLASILRVEDSDNRLSPKDLGLAIADKFPPSLINEHGNALAAFVERANPDKHLGADRLAELIVAEFRLDKVG